MRLAEDFEHEHDGATRIFLQHRAYVTSGVTEAAAFLESFINELFGDAADFVVNERRGLALNGLPDSALPALATYWEANHRRASALDKYKEAPGPAGSSACRRRY